MVKGLFTLLRANKSQNANGKQVEVTIGTVIQKDSNKNGIADWEEYLWGLDPMKNGAKNKEFIDSKKADLAQKGIIVNDDSKAITESEILSQEFFAAVISLQQTGNLNPESLKSISDALGQNIELLVIPDIYTKNMLKIVENTEDTRVKFFSDSMNLVVKYQDKDIGKELTLISQGIGNNDPQALYAADTVAQSYRAFGADLVKIPVPNTATSVVVSLANNYEKTAQSIESLTQILTDQITGMRGIISYKKYSDALTSDIGKLSEVLK